MKYFFCGIGGIGMSSIARLLVHRGHAVSGSDRSFDQGLNVSTKKELIDAGMTLFPQDGSGVTPDTDYVIISSAVEETIPDVQKALSSGILILKRAQLLASLFNTCTGIAIGGTSGKTTITAMTGHILYEAGLDPTMMNGGISLNTYHGEKNSNLICGRSHICVIEADESDGSIELYEPAVSVVSNISLDHKPLPELKTLFENFIAKAKLGAVVNDDCPYLKSISMLNPHLVTFSTQPLSSAHFVASDIRTVADGTTFKINGADAFLPLFGHHNVENALAAIAACSLMKVSLQTAIEALKTFKGTKRRIEHIGTVHAISVFDDYAHNPEKIKATLRTLRQKDHRLWVFFQPHGFAPTRLMKKELIQVFATESFPQDMIYFPPIFYVGGTVAKDISSQDLVDGLAELGKKAFLADTRDVFIKAVQEAAPGDRIIIMGARDNTLTDLAKEILTVLKEKHA